MTGYEIRDRLLLAFAELQSHGIATWDAAEPDPARARAELLARVRRQATHGLGSYIFWIRADEIRFAPGEAPPLYTSGPEVDRAAVAALAHQGLAATPGPTGTLLVDVLSPAR